MYSQKVIDKFTNPKNVGLIKCASGVGSATNLNGDIIKIYLKVEDGNITLAKFKTFGCAAAIAVSEVITTLVLDKTTEQAQKISVDEILQEFDQFPMQKEYCLQLAKDAVAAAVIDYNKKEARKAAREKKAKENK